MLSCTLGNSDECRHQPPLVCGAETLCETSISWLHLFLPAAEVRARESDMALVRPSPEHVGREGVAAAAAAAPFWELA